MHMHLSHCTCTCTCHDALVTYICIIAHAHAHAHALVTYTCTLHMHLLHAYAHMHDAHTYVHMHIALCPGHVGSSRCWSWQSCGVLSLLELAAHVLHAAAGPFGRGQSAGKTWAWGAVGLQDAGQRVPTRPLRQRVEPALLAHDAVGLDVQPGQSAPRTRHDSGSHQQSGQ